MAERNIVVTGGASGLGKAVALNLAAAGAQVVIVDLNEAAAGAVVEEIRRAGGSAFAAIGDITTRESAKALFDKAVAGAGRIHGLVNCAGVYPRKPILEISDADWDRSST